MKTSRTTRRVEDWHDRIAGVWKDAIGAAGVALLVWGDPSLYDPTLPQDRGAAGAKRIGACGAAPIHVRTAAHGIALNEIGAPFVVTTGRRLRDEGLPAGVDTAVVMLDGECSFQAIDPAGVSIWWGLSWAWPRRLRSGPLAEVGARIVSLRAEERARHGWIMDIYLLRRG